MDAEWAEILDTIELENKELYPATRERVHRMAGLHGIGEKEEVRVSLGRKLSEDVSAKATEVRKDTR